jgi:CRP/FNR family cyclic AMP-dependent transcriptional regulator
MESGPVSVFCNRPCNRPYIYQQSFDNNVTYMTVSNFSEAPPVDSPADFRHVALQEPQRSMLRETVRTRLQSDALLSALPLEEIDWLLERGQIHHYEAGELIHSKHAPSDHLYRVLSGAVRISSASADGREAILNYYGPDEWFGHIGLLDGLPRTHDIRTCGPCAVLSLPRNLAEALLERHPALYRTFSLMLCGLIRAAFAALEDQALLTLSARLAKHLVTLADIYGVGHASGTLIGLHLPQEDLSMLLGSSRQTVNRKLSEWAKLGWIEVHYSQIVLINRSALCELGGGMETPAPASFTRIG